MARRREKIVGEVASSPSLPDLRGLHERHVGLTPEVCACYAQAAEVALSRHGSPPATLLIHANGTPRTRPMSWSEPGSRATLAWANRDDTTRDGAYSVSLATVEAELELVAVSRAEVKTGADYYVARAGTSDLEDAERLEVSGISEGARAVVSSRVRQKREQAAAGRSDLRAIVAVVAFKERMVVLERLAEKGGAEKAETDS